MEQVRSGIVTNRYPDDGTVRVKMVGYRDNYITHPLPIVYRKTHRDKDYWLPDIGEHVVVLFEGSGLEHGYVLGSIYSAGDRPTAPLTEDDGEVYGFEDESGMSVRFNRARRSANIEHSSGSRVSMTRDGVVEVVAATTMRIVSSDGQTSVEVDTETGKVAVSAREHAATSAQAVTTEASRRSADVGSDVTDADSRATTVTGGSKENIAGSRGVSVGGNENKAVAGNKTELVAGSSERTLGKGEKTTVVTGNVDIDVVTGAITLKALAGISLESPLNSVELKTPLAKISGGSLVVNGSVAPSGSGPFCGLPVCLFTGSPHVGNTVLGT